VVYAASRSGVLVLATTNDSATSPRPLGTLPRPRTAYQANGVRTVDSKLDILVNDRSRITQPRAETPVRLVGGFGRRGAGLGSDAPRRGGVLPGEDPRDVVLELPTRLVAVVGVLARAFNVMASMSGVIPHSSWLGGAGCSRTCW
jgi:hypothetical protein